MRGHYRFCFCVVLVFQFYVTRSEMNLVLLFVSFSLLPFPILLLRQTPQARLVYSRLITTHKRRGCLHLPVRQSGLPQPMRKTDRETPTLRYIDTRKVCVEGNSYLRSTLRRVYDTPRGVTPAMLLSSFDCGSSIVQKQSVSNAF